MASIEIVSYRRSQGAAFPGLRRKGTQSAIPGVVRPDVVRNNTDTFGEIYFAIDKPKHATQKDVKLILNPCLPG